MLGSSSKLRNLATIAAMMAVSIAPPGRQHGNRHQPKDTAPNDDTPNERHPRQRRRYSDRRGSKRYRKAMQRTRTQRAIEAQGKPDTKANRAKGYPLARLGYVKIPPLGRLTQRVGHPVRVMLNHISNAKDRGAAARDVITMLAKIGRARAALLVHKARRYYR